VARPNPMLAMTAGLGAAFALWAVLWLGSARIESNLERGCTSLIDGADLEEIVATLGMEGYRAGCREPGAGGEGADAAGAAPDPRGGLPCQTKTVGSLVDFPYLCEGSDCSLYWRVNEVGCLVELDPKTLTLTGATFMPLGATLDGAQE